MILVIVIEALKEVFCIFRIWNCIWKSCHPVLCPIQCETHLLLVRLERDLFNLAEKLPFRKGKMSTLSSVWKNLFCRHLEGNDLLWDTIVYILINFYTDPDTQIQVRASFEPIHVIAHWPRYLSWPGPKFMKMPFKVIFWPFYLPPNVFIAANCTYLSTKYLQTIFSRILFLVREGFRCNWGGKWNQRPYFQTHLFLLYPQDHKVRAISTAENPCTNFSGNIWATPALKRSFEDKFVSYFNLIGKELRFSIRRRTSPPPN